MVTSFHRVLTTVRAGPQLKRLPLTVVLWNTPNRSFLHRYSWRRVFACFALLSCATRTTFPPPGRLRGSSKDTRSTSSRKNPAKEFGVRRHDDFMVRTTQFLAVTAACLGAVVSGSSEFHVEDNIITDSLGRKRLVHQ